MIFAVIDTNVLVAAMLSHHADSSTIRVIKAIDTGAFVPVFSEDILKEYRTVLTRDKFRLDKRKISALIGLVSDKGEVITPNRYDAPMPDESDRVFYEVALAEPGAKLVTGNLKHYPVSPIVVTPAQFCELLGV